MSTAERSVVYVDVDDEITAIIEKLTKADERIVALVLPKRATVLQSIVNMKLLKRAAEQAKKRLVLVTSEAGLLPLAGAVGVHVARSLDSKPAVPPPPRTLTESAPIETVEEPDLPLDAEKPVGELAGLSMTPVDEAIEIDNSGPAENAAAGVKSAKTPKNKKLKIPNFESFRLRLFLALGILLLLIIGWFMANKVLPRATITIQTKTSAINSDLTFTASAPTKQLDAEKRTVPAVVKKLDKTASQKAPATGKKDVGTKASGTVTLINCNKDDQTLTVPAGTGVSAGGLTFITTAGATIPPSNFTGGGACKNDSSKTVGVIAQNNGDQYNVSAQNYSVAGFTSISGSGSAMTGGTSKVITVVSQPDVDAARQKFGDQLKAATADEVKAALKTDGLLPLDDTFVATDPAITPTPAIDAEASEVTVAGSVSSSMFGVKASDLNTLIKNDVNKQINPAEQSIVSDGLSDAVLKVVDKPAPDTVNMELKTIAQVGAKLDEQEIKKAVAGQKRGPTERLITDKPGVQGVTINYSPFWVYKTPKSTGKIKVIIKQASDSSKQ